MVDAFEYANQKYKLNSSKQNISIPSIQTNNMVAGDMIEFKIKPMKNAFLQQNQTYLKFSLTVTTGATHWYFDYSAYSLISRIIIKQSGHILENINEIGVLMSCFMDYNTNLVQRTSVCNALLGTNDIFLDISKAGYKRIGTTNDTGVTYTYCLPLPSSVIGILGGDRNYLPLDLKDDIHVEIYLQRNPLNCFILTSNTTATFSLTNPKLAIKVISVEPEAMKIIKSANNNTYIIPSNTYNSQFSSLPTGTIGMNTVICDFHYQSLDSIFFGLRQSNYNNTYNGYFQSQRFMGVLTSYQLRINNKCYPREPVECYEDANVSYCNGYNDVVSCFYDDTFDYTKVNTCVLGGGYTSSAGIGSYNATSNQGTLFGYSFKSLNRNTNRIFKGKDTSDDIEEVMINLHYDATATDINIDVFAFANYSYILEVRDGYLYVHN